MKRLYRRSRHAPGVIAESSDARDSDNGGVKPILHILGVILYGSMTRHVACLLAWGQAGQHLHNSSTCLHGCNAQTQGVERWCHEGGRFRVQHVVGIRVNGASWSHASVPHASGRYEANLLKKLLAGALDVPAIGIQS